MSTLATSTNMPCSGAPGEEPYLDDVVTTPRLWPLRRPLPSSVACRQKTTQKALHIEEPGQATRLDTRDNFQEDQKKRKAQGVLHPIDLHKGDERLGPHNSLFQRRVHDVKFTLTKGQFFIGEIGGEHMLEGQPSRVIRSYHAPTTSTTNKTGNARIDPDMVWRAILEGHVQLTALLHENISVADTASSSFTSSQTSTADHRGPQSRKLVVLFFSLLHQFLIALEGRRDENILALRSQVCTSIRAARAPHRSTLTEMQAFEYSQKIAIGDVQALDLCHGISSEFRSWFSSFDENGAEDVGEWGKVEKINDQLIEASNKIAKMHGLRREMEALERQHNDLVGKYGRKTEHIGDVSLPMEDGNSSVDRVAGNGNIDTEMDKTRVGHPVASCLVVVGAASVGMFLFVGTAIAMVFW